MSEQASSSSQISPLFPLDVKGVETLVEQYLVLHDPARLLRLLSDRERPVRLILAGKAHPADQAGLGAGS